MRYARSDGLALLALGAVLIVFSALRQEFIGDGVRHLQGAIESNVPHFGAPRWLLFPGLVWLLVHPFAAIGLVSGIEPAIQILLAICVLSGIVYLGSLALWLRAEGHAPARTGALVMAGSTIPFLVLYSDIAEVQVPGAIVVLALAVCRARFAAGHAGDGTIVATVGAIALASLLYQGLVFGLLFLPLVAPFERLRNRKVIAASAGIALAVPAIMILARLAAGDGADLAVATTLRGESGARVRSSLGTPTPLKWAAALVAGPPQAIVGLWKFQGLPAMARGVMAHDIDAATNAARLGVGLAFLALFGRAIFRTRDWRIAIAALGVVVLPMIRNHQYTYSKFYILWPVVVALAALKLRPRHVAVAAAVALTLNALLVTRQIVEGRARYTAVVHAYRWATPGECFFTSDWSAPFDYRWPGSSAAVISILWANDAAMSGDHVTPALRECFCRTGRVWTNTTAAAGDEVTRLTEHFSAGARSVEDFLLRPGDGESIGAGVAGLFVYSEERKQELCGLAQR